MIRTLSAAALAAASLLVSSAPANAACVGERSTFYVCVTAPTVGVGEETYCVFAGGDECTDVSVPVPHTSGEIDVDCGGRFHPDTTPPISVGPDIDVWC